MAEPTVRGITGSVRKKFSNKAGMGARIVGFLFNPNGDDSWRTDDLGNDDSFTFNQMPKGAVYGKQYGWYVKVFIGAEGFGVPFYAYAIAFGG